MYFTVSFPILLEITPPFSTSSSTLTLCIGSRREGEEDEGLEPKSRHKNAMMPRAPRMTVRTRRFGTIILSGSESGAVLRGGQHLDPAWDEGQRTYISETSALER